MRIKRLYIRDFGIIRNQTLDDLGSGIVVIGGPNRAGKTSFMQVLRYLGYGFPKGANLPPATHEYHVEASLVLEDQPWEVLITGYSKPRFRSLVGDFDFPDSPFGEVDLFTYHQLFTVSLDELRALPEGVLKDDQSRLQSVLLGAGLSDAARLPKLRDELEAEADKIGGKHGNPSVRMFKPYYIAIQEGVAQRDKALELIDGYRAKVEELKDTEASIEKLQKQLGDARQQIIRLEVLLHNYGDYQNWSKQNSILAEPLADTLMQHYPKGLLEKARNLRERYEVALTDYQGKVASLNQERDGREAREWQATLLAKANDIELAVRNLSGISARIEAYERRLVEVQSEKRRIKADIDAIDPLWQGEFGEIDEIIEKVEQEQLSRSLKEYELLNQAVGIWGRLQGIAVLDFGKQFRMYAMGATIAMIVGIILGLWQPLVGTSIVVVAVVGLGLYFLHRTLADGEARAERRGLVGRLVDIGDKLDFAVDVEDLEACSLRLQERLSKIEKDLEFYRNVLDLPTGVSLDRYQARLTSVQKLHEKIQSLRRQDQELEEDGKRLSPALEVLYDLGLELGYMMEPPRPTTASFNRLAMVVDKMSIHLGMAKAVAAAEDALVGIQGQVKELISENVLDVVIGEVAVAQDEADLGEYLQEVITAGEKRAFYEATAKEREILAERMRHSLGRKETTALEGAFGDVEMDLAIAQEPDDRTLGDGDYDYLKILDLLYQEYPSMGDLEEVLRLAEESSSQTEIRIKQLEQGREKLRLEIESLDTDQTLAKAQRSIDEARSQLEPLAFAYSVNKVAALLLDTLHKEFLSEVKDTLLTRASELLTEMTDGEYQEIMPLDELTEPGFQVARDGGMRQLPSALSRGTREQLFLAVRLGRIWEIEPALPVILDDSLVNFDPRHAEAAVRAILGLSERNQIFVLTCHPELVELVQRTKGDAPVQYWQLDRGVFSQATGPGLIEFLK